MLVRPEERPRCANQPGILPNNLCCLACICPLHCTCTSFLPCSNWEILHFLRGERTVMSGDGISGECQLCRKNVQKIGKICSKMGKICKKNLIGERQKNASCTCYILLQQPKPKRPAFLRRHALKVYIRRINLSLQIGQRPRENCRGVLCAGSLVQIK